MPELLIVVMVLGAGIGLVLRYLLPGRETYGLLLLPAIGACIAGIVWASLFVADFATDEGWIWAASLSATLVVSIVVPLVISKRRPASDERRLASLLDAK